MRDRLIELLEEECGFWYMPDDKRREKLADHLIANGVVIIDPKKYPPLTNRGIIQTICGVPLDEMAELVNAKQDGRIIVPPCKVGDALYWVDANERKIEKFVVYAMEIVGLCDNYFSFTVQFRKENGYREFNYQFFNTDFGKTVFLTREEAEAALAERSDDNGN